MTICANYTKTVVFFCAFCHMVSGAVWWCCRAVSCAVVWCGSVTLCGAFLASFYGFMVSSTSIALKWLCGRSGASGRVSRCRHGVGCVVSLSLVWCCGSLCGSLVVFSGCGGLWSGCVSLVVSVAILVCCVWCCVSGAVVLSGVGLFSGGLVVWCAVFWSLVVSSLVWSSGVWSGVWYIISSALNFYAHEKSATLHDTLPLAYHTINFILELLRH